MVIFKFVFRTLVQRGISRGDSEGWDLHIRFRGAPQRVDRGKVIFTHSVRLFQDAEGFDMVIYKMVYKCSVDRVEWW